MQILDNELKPHLAREGVLHKEVTGYIKLEDSLWKVVLDSGQVRFITSEHMESSHDRRERLHKEEMGKKSAKRRIQGA